MRTSRLTLALLLGTSAVLVQASGRKLLQDEVADLNVAEAAAEVSFASRGGPCVPQPGRLLAAFEGLATHRRLRSAVRGVEIPSSCAFRLPPTVHAKGG